MEVRGGGGRSTKTSTKTSAKISANISTKTSRPGFSPYRLGGGLRLRPRESLPELELLPESDSLPELEPELEPLLEPLLALALRARRLATGDASRERRRLRGEGAHGKRRALKRGEKSEARAAWLTLPLARPGAPRRCAASPRVPGHDSGGGT